MASSESISLITGKTGEQHVLAIDDAEIYRTLLGNGDFILVTGAKMNATMNGANKVDIANGTAIMQGRQIKIRSGFVELDTDGGVIGYKREDAIVIEYSKDNEGIESAVLKVIKGANGSTYIRPTITTGNIDAGETHQMLLWSVRYDGINYDSLVDHRVILDTTPIQTAINLANSYQSQIEAQMAALRAEFATFADGLEDTMVDYADSLAEAVGARISGFYRGHSDTFTSVDGGTACEVEMPAGYTYTLGDLVIIDVNGLMMHTGYTHDFDDGVFTITFSDAVYISNVDSVGVTVIR